MHNFFILLFAFICPKIRFPGFESNATKGNKVFHVFVCLSTFEKRGGVKYAGEFFAIAN